LKQLYRLSHWQGLNILRLIHRITAFAAGNEHTTATGHIKYFSKIIGVFCAIKQ
jgi:hypothetical protein